VKEVELDHEHTSLNLLKPDLVAETARAARQKTARRYPGRQPNVLGRLHSLPRVSLGRALALPGDRPSCGVSLKRRPWAPSPQRKTQA
jgi:hypothetical protein